METAICNEITRFVRESPDNNFPGTGRPYFDEPLVGFAAGNDPLFMDYKRIIGDFHGTPQEILDGASTVISWVLPVTRMTRESNRSEDHLPSREWALTRNNGENFNSMLRRHLVVWLEENGHRAVAPQLMPEWRQLDDPCVGIASTWSERHAAYAAGLGTFSLNDALITERGIAHRLGSVITTLPLQPTLRTEPDYRHNCLWFREESCGSCIARCPVGALSRQGHDKSKCRVYVYGTVPQAVGQLYDVAQTGCGLCQTKVPCEATVPSGRKNVPRAVPSS